MIEANSDVVLRIVPGSALGSCLICCNNKLSSSAGWVPHRLHTGPRHRWEWVQRQRVHIPGMWWVCPLHRWFDSALIKRNLSGLLLMDWAISNYCSQSACRRWRGPLVLLPGELRIHFRRRIWNRERHRCESREECRNRDHVWQWFREDHPRSRVPDWGQAENKNHVRIAPFHCWHHIL